MPKEAFVRVRILDMQYWNEVQRSVHKALKKYKTLSLFITQAADITFKDICAMLEMIVHWPIRDLMVMFEGKILDVDRLAKVILNMPCLECLGIRPGGTELQDSLSLVETRSFLRKVRTHPKLEGLTLGPSRDYAFTPMGEPNDSRVLRLYAEVLINYLVALQMAVVNSTKAKVFVQLMKGNSKKGHVLSLLPTDVIRLLSSYLDTAPVVKHVLRTAEDIIPNYEVALSELYI